jgi:two-component system, LytTR family, sensor kinase
MIKQLISNKTLRIHAIAWIIYTFYYAFLVKLFYHIPISEAFVARVLLYRLGEIALFYANVNLVFSRFTTYKKITYLLFIFLICLIAFLLYFYLLEYYLFLFFEISVTKSPPVFDHFIAGSVLQASTFIIYALGYSFAQRVIQQQIEIGKEKERNAQLEKEKAEVEYTFLRSQVNPHFMFNTLNMLYEQVRKLKPGVGDLVIQFAGMIRYATSKAMQQDEVGLKEELQFVDDFLDIQKRRFKDALLIDYKKEGDVQSQRIVPMVLFTFIENAIKHGMNDDPEFPLIIRMSIIQDRFTFMVHNRKNMKPHGFDKGETGISLEILRKRLNAVYKNGGYSLTIDDLEEEFIVNFIVDFKEVKK